MKLYFKHTLLGFLLTVFVAGLFAGLGRWQLDRAGEKKEIIETQLHRAAEPAVELPARFEDPLRWRHRKVRFAAVPLSERQFLLDNQIREGRVGFNVLTAFKASGAGLILVDRGWVPLGADRSDLPEVSIPGEPMRLEGSIYVPYGEPFTLGGIDDGESGWPRIIQFLDFKALGRRLGEPLRPFVVRLAPSLPHGYLRTWRLTSVSPEKHLAYAFQWFALSAAAFAVFVVLTLRRRRK